MEAETLSDPPIAWDEALGGWTVSGYELVRKALQNPGGFTSEGNPVADNLAGEAMLVTDSPVHDAAAPDLEVIKADYGDTAIVRGPQRLLLRKAGKRG